MNRGGSTGAGATATGTGTSSTTDGTPTTPSIPSPYTRPTLPAPISQPMQPPTAPYPPTTAIPSSVASTLPHAQSHNAQQPHAQTHNQPHTQSHTHLQPQLAPFQTFPFSTAQPSQEIPTHPHAQHQHALFMPDTSSPLDILLPEHGNMWYNASAAQPLHQTHQTHAAPQPHQTSQAPQPPHLTQQLFQLPPTDPHLPPAATTLPAALHPPPASSNLPPRARRQHSLTPLPRASGAAAPPTHAESADEHYVRAAAQHADDAKIKYRNELKTEQRRREFEARERGEPLSARDKERERSRRESSVTRRRAEVYVAQLEITARRLPGVEAELDALRREVRALRAGMTGRPARRESDEGMNLEGGPAGLQGDS